MLTRSGVALIVSMSRLMAGRMLNFVIPPKKSWTYAKAAKKFCKDYGMEFMILTEDHLAT